MVAVILFLLLGTWFPLSESGKEFKVWNKLIKHEEINSKIIFHIACHSKKKKNPIGIEGKCILYNDGKTTKGSDC